jgi:replicative DNA helicase
MDNQSNQPSTTKQLPHNIDAEMSILGAVLIDSDAIVKIADKIAADDFYEPTHKHIYEAVTSLYEARKPIDVLTLSEKLKSTGMLDVIGGAVYLTELTNFVPTASHAEHYADIVFQKSLRRKLIRASAEINKLGHEDDKEAQVLIEGAETALFNVSSQHIKQSIVSIDSVLSDSFDRLDELHNDKTKLRGLPTGYTDLDEKIAGLQRSDLFILAARPSMGKTTLALNIAHNIAMSTKTPILLFSLEMGKEQLVDRMLAMQSGVNAWALRTGNLSDSDFEKIGDAMGALSEAPIYIDDTPGLTVNELRTKARREAHKRGIGLIVVDYLQLMSGSNKMYGDSNRVQEVSEISRGLKGVARELDVPVMALSQLSRSVESRNPKIPQLADLRESGSIEQDADVVAFIYRDEFYNEQSERKHIADILIRKHRNGPTGSVELYFDGDKQRFSNLDKHHAEPFEN